MKVVEGLTIERRMNLVCLKIYNLQPRNAVELVNKLKQVVCNEV